MKIDFRSFLHCCTLLGMLAGLCACREDYTPRPRCYMRIDLPEKAYRNFDTAAYPATFRMPAYARFVPVESNQRQKNTLWADIAFPGLNAAVYCSYIFRPNLDSCITNTLFFIQRHISKATGVDEWEINDPDQKKYGYLYHIKGSDVASPYQFYLTDSNRYFVRGSFSINCTPNNDSLAPVIRFIKADIDTLIESWRWK
ncbi:MAG: hypothetical protein NC396_01145 [Bacteroides sp.]|nr:hypothetical protein [Bacteroides sp.]MCM1085444.1 hypothetical protein [Bacteroides sp.]